MCNHALAKGRDGEIAFVAKAVSISLSVKTHFVIAITSLRIPDS
jgi:hypothetical protein